MENRSKFQYNKIFGVEYPDINDLNPRDLNHFFQNFGIETNSFISNIPEKWFKSFKNKAYEQLQRMQDGPTKKYFEEIINSKDYPIKKRIYTKKLTDQNYDSGKTIVENLISIQSKEDCFHAIFTNGSRDEYNNTYTISTILDNEALRKDLGFAKKTGLWIDAKAESFGKVCEPLFTISNEIYLQDQFFNPVDRKFHGRVFENIYEKMIDCGVERFIILFNKEKVNQNRIESYLEELKKNVLKRGKRWVAIKHDTVTYSDLDIDGKELSHKRYIYSIYGGLEFDKGFQESSNSNKTLVDFHGPEQFLEFKNAFRRVLDL